MRESLSGKGALPFPPAGTKDIETLLFWELVVTAESDLSAAVRLAQSSKAAMSRCMVPPILSQDASIDARNLLCLLLMNSHSP